MLERKPCGTELAEALHMISTTMCNVVGLLYHACKRADYITVLSQTTRLIIVRFLLKWPTKISNTDTSQTTGLQQHHAWQGPEISKQQRKTG